MSSRPQDALMWRKSKASGSGNCVEVAASDRMVYVRDSKAPTRPVLTFTQDEWTAFLTGVQDGEFTLKALGS